MNTDEQRDWDLWVNFAVYAYDSGQHTTVKILPNELMMGRTLRSPNELLRTENVHEAGDVTEYHRKLITTMKHSLKCAEGAREQEQQRQAKYYNRRTKQQKMMMPGERVWVFRLLRGPKASKFIYQWIGPMRVIEPAGYDNCLVERKDTEDDPERYIVHVSFLVTY
ncbi:hypothetical protein PC128_g24000 [Phytophthora cactorum]|nr:hypothetical protein PC120_g16324 [Phytophthora cactorum]KAG3146520.1 hypothetical protein PC128_g24000 [Phytophthora cactorum]KAG4040072.1 hypothetical protein PC123_g24385 [Phytophthora cactorum]